MSLIKCDKCRNIVDSDDFTEGFVETKYGDKFYCEPCTEDREAEQQAMDDKMSACEAHAEAAHA